MAQSYYLYRDNYHDKIPSHPFPNPNNYNRHDYCLHLHENGRVRHEIGRR